MGVYWPCIYVQLCSHKYCWPAGNLPLEAEWPIWPSNTGNIINKNKGHFLLATVIAASIFLLGAGIVHITNIMQTGNMAPGNAGFALLIDILIPVVLIILMVGYKLTKKSEVSEN